MIRDQVQPVVISSKNNNTLIVHFETVSKETIIFSDLVMPKLPKIPI